jgi:hypothetical protein
MKNHLLKSALGLTLLFTATVVNAGSDAAFPKDWASWPIQHSSAIPGSSTPIPTNVPPIVQETIKTYNWVQDGKGSKYNVRVNPTQMSGYKAHNGKFQDGPTAVLELTDIKVLLVTEHLLGGPVYGAYSYDGKEISGAHPSLSPKKCQACHTGYGEACVNGACSK